MDWLTVVVADPVKAMLIKISGYVPTLIGAILILVVGWILAKLIEPLLVKVLKIVKLDVISEKAGIAKILAQGEIKGSLSEVLGIITYWLVILITIVTALNSLNLTVAANLISRLVEYVPNIIAAIFVLVLGTYLAGFVGSIVKTTAANAGITNAKSLAEITKTILVIFAIVVAIEQLQIATHLVAFALNIILAAIGLGIAIAFGLGCKDIAGKGMQDFLNKMKK